MKSFKSKVFLFGVDGLVPELVFGRYKKHLPTLSRLMQEGTHALMRTTIPPTSIVAWTSINSGRDPGETGIHSYTQKPGSRGSKARLTNSKDVHVPMLWDMLSKEKKTTVALNIPLTYPVRPIRGIVVSDFLTPSFDEHSVYPKPFRGTVKNMLRGKDYLFDVAGFTGYKKLDLDFLIKQTYVMSDQHFKIARYCIEKYDWDLFDMVVIGTDRLHHMFWKHMDPHHKEYVKNSKYKNVILDYYRYMDRNFAKLLRFPKIDERTTVIVTSDHGMDRMDSRVNLNDWLRGKGYLILKKDTALDAPRRLDYAKDVDWKKTRAIASGGYQGRIYLFGKNKNAIKKKLMNELENIRDEKGKKMENHIYDTEKIYRKKDKEAPDVIVYFDNLRYGVNNDIGNAGLYSRGTSVGVDDAGHSPYGTFIMRSPILKKRGDAGMIDVLDIAPTVLKAAGSPAYKKLPGKPLI